MTSCFFLQDSYFVYSSTNGTWSPASCILASVYFSDALSPAFYIESQTTYLSDDYDPKEYSTWTESRYYTGSKKLPLTVYVYIHFEA